MHRPNLRRLWTVLALSGTILFASALVPASAQDDARNALIFQVQTKQTSLSLIEKSSRVISLTNRIKTVDGFDPAVVKVTTLSDPQRPEVNDPRKIRVTAVAPGLTSLVLVDETGESYVIEILVSGDTKQLEAIIRKAFPDSSVHAIKVKDSVLLLGWVNQPDQLTPIVELAEQFHPKVLNYLRVSGIQQVMLQVKIMEVQRGRIRTMGFNFLNLRDGSYVTSTPGSIATLASLAAPFGGPAGVTGAPGNATAMFGVITNNNVFQGFIEALKQESLLRILAEPTLVTVNGRPANFLSGGEFPILVPGGLGTVTVQFKPFGVRLEFVPMVLGNGRVRLEVAPEVSEKDFTTQVTVGNTVVPGLTTRRANAQVEMNFGQTMILSGLINNRVQSRTQKVPFLGELPWVGAAFRRVSHDEAETELLILVTPQLAEPLDPSQVPEYGPGQTTVSPTDSELYGSGYLEVPRYGPEPGDGFDGAMNNQPPTGDFGTGTTVPTAPANSAVPPADPAFDATAPVDSLPPSGTTYPVNPPPAEPGIDVPNPSSTQTRRIPTSPLGARRPSSMIRDSSVQSAGATRSATPRGTASPGAAAGRSGSATPAGGTSSPRPKSTNRPGPIAP
jgi:pilus assembly protein CpaC